MIILSNFFSFISWRDLIEIIFFSTVFYYISKWLHADHHHQLLFYFLGYCLLFLTTAWLQLPVVHPFLSYFAPVIAILFILLHQETLQKKFITLRNYIPVKQIPSNWHQELIRIALIAHNKEIPLHIIIEQRDNLNELLHSPFLLDAPFQVELLQTLINSTSFIPEKFIWLKSDGTIRSINVSVQYKIDERWNNEIDTMPRWKQNATILSTKTDGMIIATSEEQTTTFTVIHQETELSSLSAENCIKLLKKITLSALNKKGKTRHELKKESLNRQQYTS